MVSILSVGGYFVGANGGCQTPCLVISACAVAETALASTPPPGHVAATSPLFKLFKQSSRRLSCVLAQRSEVGMS